METETATYEVDENGEIIEPEPTETPDTAEPEPETDETVDPDEPEATAEGRCEAETTVGGTLYRCALETDHDGEHSFTPVDATDDGEPVEEPLPSEDREQAKALQRKANAYSKGVVDLLGDDLSGWIACELCSGYYPGLHPPFEALGGAPAETVAALRNIIGLPSLDTFEQDKYATACTICRGRGRVLTGSLVPGQEALPCKECAGKGWHPVGNERRVDFEVTPAASAVSGDGAEPEPAPDADPWGRPKGDPLYGVMPGFEPYHQA